MEQKPAVLRLGLSTRDEARRTIDEIRQLIGESKALLETTGQPVRGFPTPCSRRLCRRQF